MKIKIIFMDFPKASGKVVIQVYLNKPVPHKQLLKNIITINIKLCNIINFKINFIINYKYSNNAFIKRRKHYKSSFFSLKFLH